MNCFVFRQDVDRYPHDLAEEIWQGRLRQGWSWDEGVSLLQDEEKCIQQYARMLGCGLTDARKRYRSLRRMLQVKEGDLMVVPKQPDADHFLIMQACRKPGVWERGEGECYGFIEPLGEGDQNDYRHVVYIRPDSVRQFHYDAVSVPPIIKSRLKGRTYPGPVTRIADAELVLAILECFTKSPSHADLESANVTERERQRVRSAAYKTWLKEVRNMHNADLEKLFHEYMQGNGYTIFAKNQWDGKGGDIDFACERTYEIVTPLEVITEHIVYLVQVKQKTGIDNEDVAGVRELVQQRPKFQERGDLVQSVLISTADDFTDRCKQEAKQHDVMLICGEQLAEMYLRNVVG